MNVNGCARPGPDSVPLHPVPPHSVPPHSVPPRTWAGAGAPRWTGLPALDGDLRHPDAGAHGREAGGSQPGVREWQAAERVRERAADERNELLDERMARLLARTRELSAISQRSRERARRALERGIEALDVSRESMLRAQAAFTRAQARQMSEKADVSTTVKRNMPDGAGIRPDDLAWLTGYVSVLRKRTAAAAAQLAEVEDEVARVQDELASRFPGSGEHTRRAHEAREMARLAREAERKFRGP